MNEKRDQPEPDDLSISEKIFRVQDLWDEIARTPDEVELTPAQKEEVERRMAEHRRAPGTYSTWKELKNQLERER